MSLATMSYEEMYEEYYNEVGEGEEVLSFAEFMELYAGSLHDSE